MTENNTTNLGILFFIIIIIIILLVCCTIMVMNSSNKKYQNSSNKLIMGGASDEMVRFLENWYNDDNMDIDMNTAKEILEHNHYQICNEEIKPGSEEFIIQMVMKKLKDEKDIETFLLLNEIINHTNPIYFSKSLELAQEIDSQRILQRLLTELDLELIQKNKIYQILISRPVGETDSNKLRERGKEIANLKVIKTMIVGCSGLYNCLNQKLINTQAELSR